MIESNGLDIYLRHTSVTGNSYVHAHRVWNKKIFLATRKSECDDLNAKQKVNEPKLAKVEQITELQYQRERDK